jgi:tetratricopeptide (TPR) repeat protein
MRPISLVPPPVLALCLCLFAPLAAKGADWVTDNDLCAGAQGAAAVEACTRMLTFGQLSYDERAQVYVNRGSAFAHAGDAASAIADFNDAIRNWPNDAWAYNNRGVVYEVLLRQYDQAYQDYEMAVSIDPSNGRARKNLARMASLVNVPAALKLKPPAATATDPAVAPPLPSSSEAARQMEQHLQQEGYINDFLSESWNYRPRW